MVVNTLILASWRSGLELFLLSFQFSLFSRQVERIIGFEWRTIDSLEKGWTQTEKEAKKTGDICCLLLNLQILCS